MEESALQGHPYLGLNEWNFPSHKSILLSCRDEFSFHALIYPSAHW